MDATPQKKKTGGQQRSMSQRSLAVGGSLFSMQEKADTPETVSFLSTSYLCYLKFNVNVLEKQKNCT